MGFNVFAYTFDQTMVQIRAVILNKMALASVQVQVDMQLSE